MDIAFNKTTVRRDNGRPPLAESCRTVSSTVVWLSGRVGDVQL